jgi:hypothetical protein
MIKKKKKKKY